MLTATPVEGYIASCAAVRDTNQWDTVGRIASPALVIAGTHDASTLPADGRKLAERISGARYVELDAAHISNVEAAERFTAELTGFLAD
jgi:3-oxoadipate enol-lactonase